MKVLIVDDSQLWIKQGSRLLEQAGYNVVGLMVSNRERFPDKLSEGFEKGLAETDVLLIDKDLGQGATSTPLICLIRHNFPKLPIIRWTGGYDNKNYMEYLGVSKIGKPTRNEEAKFVEVFQVALEEQRLILSGPMGILAAIDEWQQPDRHREEERAKQYAQLRQIAQLAEKDRVESGSRYNPWWTTSGKGAGVTKHKLGHCICDGLLAAREIEPYLPALQKVIAKFEVADEIDERFRICAEFIKTGKLEELELVNRCY